MVDMMDINPPSLIVENPTTDEIQDDLNYYRTLRESLGEPTDSTAPQCEEYDTIIGLLESRLDERLGALSREDESEDDQGVETDSTVTEESEEDGIIAPAIGGRRD